MLSVDGDADAVVEARVRKASNKFRQPVPWLTYKDVSLLMRGTLYTSCVHSCMLNGSEAWPVRKENELTLQRAELRMIRWLCSVRLTHRFTCNELRLGNGDVITQCYSEIG